MFLPSGFERLLLGHAVAIARSDIAPSIRKALVSADGTRLTLHEYAARSPSARRLQGRDAAYAIPLPQPRGSERMVVRHNRHGGMFRSITRDRFLAPTRAPYELEISLALAKLGIPTPQVVAYVLYPPGGLVQRADVCSLEVAGGRDLADILVREPDAPRAAALRATARLIGALSSVGARHHDLNAKNILLIADVAYVLDVDRVKLGTSPESARDGNLARLSRSLRKWRDKFGARVTDAEIGDLEARVRDDASDGPPVRDEGRPRDLAER